MLCCPWGSTGSDWITAGNVLKIRLEIRCGGASGWGRWVGTASIKTSIRGPVFHLAMVYVNCLLRTLELMIHKNSLYSSCLSWINYSSIVSLCFSVKIAQVSLHFKLRTAINLDLLSLKWISLLCLLQLVLKIPACHMIYIVVICIYLHGRSQTVIDLILL